MCDICSDFFLEDAVEDDLCNCFDACCVHAKVEPAHRSPIMDYEAEAYCDATTDEDDDDLMYENFDSPLSCERFVDEWDH